jgi:hypothetical protein
MSDLIADAFQGIFEHIQHDGIKKGVDQKGIDKFIGECAGLAAASGFASGVGGVATMVVGVPVDVINNIIQQFRVTLAVIYVRKGSYTVPSFKDFMKIVGMSVGVEVGAVATRAVLVTIAGQLLTRMTASTAAKAIPLLGGVIGAVVNYGFIKAIGASMKKIDL